MNIGLTSVNRCIRYDVMFNFAFLPLLHDYETNLLNNAVTNQHERTEPLALATNRQPIGNQSATNWQPIGNHIMNRYRVSRRRRTVATRAETPGVRKIRIKRTVIAPLWPAHVPMDTRNNEYQARPQGFEKGGSGLHNQPGISEKCYNLNMFSKGAIVRTLGT